MALSQALVAVWPKDRKARFILAFLFAAASSASAALGSLTIWYLLPWLARRYAKQHRENNVIRRKSARLASKSPTGVPRKASMNLKDTEKRVSFSEVDNTEAAKEQEPAAAPAPTDGLAAPAVAEAEAAVPSEAMSPEISEDQDAPLVRVLRPLRPMRTVSWQAERSQPTSVMREAIVLVMVGLPARGKSFISNSLVRYLRLLQINVKCFNAGNLRRDTGAAGGAGAKADYFSASNTSAKEEREKLAMACADHLLDWIYMQPGDTSCVAILDATNTTRERREKVLERCREAAANERGESAPPLRVVFLESICDDESILEGNYKMKLKNDDYKNSTDKDEALDDFKKRVTAYVEQYHPVEDEEVSKEEDDIATAVIRIFNGGQKMHFVKPGCSLVMLQISVLLSCFHLSHRKIFLVSEKDCDIGRLAALLRKAEAEDPDGRPVDLLCRAGKKAVRIARGVEEILEGLEQVKDQKLSSCASDLNKEGLRQPRGILSLRKLEPRLNRAMPTTPDGKPLSGWKHVLQTITRELPDETFCDLVERMREVIFTIERLPRSLIVLYSEEDVLRVLLAHFRGCAEEEDAETMPLPKGPVIELHRDHKGFSLTETELPAPIWPKEEKTPEETSATGPGAPKSRARLSLRGLVGDDGEVLDSFADVVKAAKS